MQKHLIIQKHPIMQKSHRRSLSLPGALLLAAVLMLGALQAGPAQAQEGVVDVSAQGSMLVFDPAMEYESVVLTVNGPKRVRTEEEFAAGKSFAWDLLDAEGKARPDGTYTFQLRVNPLIDGEARDMLAAARVKGNEDEVFVALCEEGRVPDGPIVQSGYFLVVGSEIIFGGDEEKSAQADGAERTSHADSADGIETSPNKQSIAGDLTVWNSLCVGTDCLHPEAFGWDTVRLKENNIRVHYDDTSLNAFPKNDWRIEINGSANGGASYYGIVDATASRRVFTLEAGAPAHSLYVDDGGRVGVGTSTPSVELHVVDGDSPALRLQQDGSSGFQPQIWDMAGNETSLFLRDVTNGSALPFRVFPGNASNTLNINNSNVGIGEVSPDEDIHITRNGVPIGVKLENSADNRNWSFKMSGSGFAINEDAEASTLLLRDSGEVRIGNNGAEEFVIRSNGDTEIDGDLDVDGDISATGMISDRNRKQQITDVDGGEVLAKVLAMPVTTWVYDHQTEVRHIGPMAQDFHAAFGLGTERSIGLGDLGGLSLAAIQELNAQFEQKLKANSQDFETQLQAKDAQIEQLEQRLEALEAALLHLQQQ